MELKFDNLTYLYLLWGVLLLAGVFAYGFRRKARALRSFATANVLGRLIPNVSIARQKMKAVVLLLAIVFLILGATGPRWGKDIVELQRRGVDLMVVLDVSRSMLAQDIAPNRLERAKIELSDLLPELRGDRIGLVTFAGKPVLSCPLTINYGAYRMALQDVTTRSSPVGGSLIGDAVRLAADSFTDEVKGHKAILLITDGEDHSSLPVEAARDAYDQKGVRVFTMGIGDPNHGARIPIMDEQGHKVYLEYQGEQVWSKMDTKVLQEMAIQGGGAYFGAGTSDPDFKQLYDKIRSKVEAREYETSRKELYHAQFQWFAGAALALLLIETLMTDRRSAVVVEAEEVRTAA